MGRVGRLGRHRRRRAISRQRSSQREGDDGAGLLLGALREGGAHFRHVAESLPQILWVSGVRGEVEYQNGRLAEYAGRAPVEPEEATDIVHPDDRARRFARWDEARRAGTFYECEYRMRRNDGEYRWFLGRALPVRNAAGEVARWFGSTTDIHELKMAQEALRESDRRKGEFLAVLSHELRNPLAPIKSALEILDRRPPGRTRRAGLNRSSRGRSISWSDWSMICSTPQGFHGARSTCSGTASSCAGSCAAHSKTINRSSMRLASRSSWSSRRRPCSSRETRTVLRRSSATCSTTRRSSPNPGGTARVRVWRDSASTDVFVRVSDTGIGMASELVASLFEPFVQADSTLERRKGGLGLGLALVKGLVELHGGSVTARSDGLGAGSAFTVRLPNALPVPPPRPAPQPGTRRDAAVSSSSKTTPTQPLACVRASSSAATRSRSPTMA